MSRKTSDLFIKWVFGTISFVLALIPTWVVLLVYHFAHPSNFMERFAVLGAGIWFAGGIQLFFFILWLRLLVEIVDM